MSNFITDCINGDALLSEVDDYIDSWHNGESNLPLHKFLGMKKNEYALFVEDEDYLAAIVTAHKDQINIVDFVSSQAKLVARSDDQAKSDRLKRWLKREGLWD